MIDVDPIHFITDDAILFDYRTKVADLIEQLGDEVIYPPVIADRK